MDYHQKVEARLRDIKEHPENHMHDFSELTECCMIDGCLDARVMEAHEGVSPSRGSRCDVRSGPCACGAWH